MDNYSNKQTNTQTREAACGSHVTTRSHPAISPHPSPERWRRTLRLPLGTSPVQRGFCAPSSQPQGAPRPPAPLPPPSEHRSLSLSPPLPAPGIRALSSGAEAPEASRGARPGNSAAQTAALRPPGWVRDEDGPVRPAHWRGRRRADGPAWPQRWGRGGGGALATGGSAGGRPEVRPAPWPAGGGRVGGSGARGARGAPGLQLAPATPAPRPRARWARPALLLPNLALELEERGREPWNSEPHRPPQYPSVLLPKSGGGGRKEKERQKQKRKSRDGVTFPRSQTCICLLQMSILLFKCL